MFIPAQLKPARVSPGQPGSSQPLPDQPEPVSGKGQNHTRPDMTISMVDHDQGYARYSYELANPVRISSRPGQSGLEPYQVKARSDMSRR